MRKTDEQILDKRRERFEAMAVRLAHHLKLSGADRFDELPVAVRQHFEGLRYGDVVRPLIQEDHAKGLSLRQLSIRYGLSKTAISNHLAK